jgi:hypothetical protein
MLLRQSGDSILKGIRQSHNLCLDIQHLTGLDKIAESSRTTSAAANHRDFDAVTTEGGLSSEQRCPREGGSREGGIRDKMTAIQ